jgi:hypothetical protein
MINSSSLKCQLNPRDLREVVEVLVAGKEDQIMLNNEGGQPQIIRRNGCSLFSKLSE